MQRISAASLTETVEPLIPGLGPAKHHRPPPASESERSWRAFLRLSEEVARPIAEGQLSRRQTIRHRDAAYRRALGIADIAALTLALAASVLLVPDAGLALSAFAALPIFVLIAKSWGLYDRDEHLLHKTTLAEVPSLFMLSTLATFALWLSDGLVIEGGLERPQAFVIWLALPLLLIALRSLARKLTARRVPGERCLLIGEEATAQYVADKLAVGAAVHAELVAVLPISASVEDSLEDGLPAALGPVLEEEEIDRVIIAAGRRDSLLYTIRELKSHGVKVSVLPDASRVAGSSVELDDLGGITLLGMRRFEISRSSRLIKRSFDIVGAGLGLLVASPLLLIAAIALKLDSRGPVLFRQHRIGRNSQPFELLKLRSMYANADASKGDVEHLNEGAEGLFKISDDPRVTRVGRHLRRFQIDELPQLFNVLRGDMSLVGPRPLIEEEDEQIEGFYRRRLDVPPGITGHWQVLGSSRSIPIKEMVKLDYLYVANWSLWGDLRLLLQTVGFVLGRRSI